MRAASLQLRALAVGLRCLSVAGVHGTSLATRTSEMLTRPTDVRVTSKIRGIQYDLDLRDDLQRTLYLTGWYEREMFQRVLKQLRRGDVLIDVGANIGVHAVPFAHALSKLGGHVYAFEPAPDCAGHLRQSAASAGLSNVEVIEVGLGRDERAVALRKREGFDTSNVGSRTTYGTGKLDFEIRVIRFDGWAAERNLSKVDIVKMDIEGGEVDALSGMALTLESKRPRLLVVEVRDDNLELAGLGGNAIHDQLSACGYSETSRVGPNVFFTPR